MTTIMINRYRKSETTNAGVLVQVRQIRFDLFRVVAFDSELEPLEVKEVETIALANLHYNYFVSRYTASEKVQIIYDTFGSHKVLYTNLEIKGRGVSFSHKTSEGLNVYTVTKLAFEKIRGNYSVRYAEQGVDFRSIA